MLVFFSELWLVFRARFRSPVEIREVATLDIRGWPHHLDLVRHMGNGVYANLATLGRWDHLIMSGCSSLFRQRGWYGVVTTQTLTYKRSLKLWQQFALETRILGMVGQNVVLEHTFIRGNEVVASVTAQLRILRRSGGSVAEREILEVFPGLSEMSAALRACWPGSTSPNADIDRGIGTSTTAPGRSRDVTLHEGLHQARTGTDPPSSRPLRNIAVG